MVGGIIAQRYAKALLNLVASEGLEVEKVGEDIQEVADTYQSSKPLQELIQDPEYSSKQKEAVIHDILEKLGSSDWVNKFCRFVTLKNRFELINEIATSYQVLANEKLGKATASMTVAYTLQPEEKKDLQKKLSEFTGKEITLEVHEDPSILGGAITTIGSLVLDGSIKNRLNLIRETISKVN